MQISTKNIDNKGFTMLPLLMTMLGFMLTSVYILSVSFYAGNVVKSVADAVTIALEAASEIDKTQYATYDELEYINEEEEHIKKFEECLECNIAGIGAEVVKECRLEEYTADADSFYVKVRCRFDFPVFGLKEKLYEQGQIIERKD